MALQRPSASNQASSGNSFAQNMDCPMRQALVLGHGPALGVLLVKDSFVRVFGQNIVA